MLGVTRHYPNGFLPKGRSELGKPGMKDGETVQKMDREAFLKHLEEFRKRLEIPFASVVAEQADFEAYKVRGIPTVVVIDAEGRVAYLAVGGMKEKLIEQAIRRLLEPEKK